MGGARRKCRGQTLAVLDVSLRGTPLNAGVRPLLFGTCRRGGARHDGLTRATWSEAIEASPFEPVATYDGGTKGKWPRVDATATGGLPWHEFGMVS